MQELVKVIIINDNALSLHTLFRAMTYSGDPCPKFYIQIHESDLNWWIVI